MRLLSFLKSDNPLNKWRLSGVMVWLLAILAVLFFVSFLVGRYPVSPRLVCQALLAPLLPGWESVPPHVQTVVSEIRLPRIVAALLVGSALAAAGAAYQNLFRNPLVSPSILGASWGAGFGAVLGMILQAAWLWVEIYAFVGGLAAVACAVGISWYCGRGSTLSLVLAGIVVSAFFQALVSILKYMADPMNTLPEITFWLMGGFSKVRPEDVAWAAIPLLLPATGLYLLRWKLHVLSVGEEEARSLGVSVRAVKLSVLVCATLLTAAATSLAGIIPWVGLLVPHMARLLVGADFSRVLPVSMLLGAVFLLFMDNLSRTLAAVEIQVGILTALVGAPCFVLLLLRTLRRR